MSYKIIDVKQLSSTNPQFNYVDCAGTLRYDPTDKVSAEFFTKNPRSPRTIGYYTSMVQSIEHFTFNDKPCLRLITLNSIYEYEVLPNAVSNE